MAVTGQFQASVASYPEENATTIPNFHPQKAVSDWMTLQLRKEKTLFPYRVRTSLSIAPRLQKGTVFQKASRLCPFVLVKAKCI